MSSLRLRTIPIIWRLIIVGLFAIPATLITPAEPVESGGGISRVIPLAGLGGAFRARNRIYRTANAYMREKNALYDRYHEKAREQLRERQIKGLRKSQVGAFVKVVELIEGERTAMEEYAEMEKRAARDRFHDQLEQIIINRILASTPVTQVLGALTKGLNSSQGFIDSAINQLTGGAGGVMADVARARDIAGKVSLVGRLIGGNAGAKIQAFGDSVDRLAGKPIAEIQAGLEQVRAELGEVAGFVEGLKGKGVTLTPSEVSREVLISLVSGEDVDPQIRSIVDLIMGRAGRNDGTFRSRAREALIQSYVARCAAMGNRLLEAIRALQSETPDSGEGSSAQVQCNPIDIERIVREAEEGSGEGSEAATSGGIGLEMISLEVINGWCFPKSEYGETYLCGYTVNWVIDYATDGPGAEVTCSVQQVDYYLSVTYYGTGLDPEGIWSHSMDVSGFYPELGEYTETITCELRSVDSLDGQPQASYQSPITVPLVTLREP